MSYFKAKMHEIRFRLGLCPRPCWGIYSALPGSLAGFKGHTSKGRKGKWGEREGRVGEEREGKGREERKGEGRKGEGGGDELRHGCWGMDAPDVAPQGVSYKTQSVQNLNIICHNFETVWGRMSVISINH